MKRFLLALLLACLLLTVPASAHPGGTDENGGHYDRSDGSYHYHHGYPAHQHTGGVCPYDFDDRTGETSGAPSGSSSSGSEEDRNFRFACYSLAILAVLFLSVAFKPVRIAAILAAGAALAYILRHVFLLLFFLVYLAYLGAMVFFFTSALVSPLINWIKSHFARRRLQETVPKVPPETSVPSPQGLDEQFWNLPRPERARIVCSGRRLSDIVPPPCHSFHIGPDLRPHNCGSGRWGEFFTVYAPVNGGRYYHADPACDSYGTVESCVIDALQVGFTPCPICAYPLDLKWYRQQIFVLRYCRQHNIPVCFDDGTPCNFGSP